MMTFCVDCDAKVVATTGPVELYIVHDFVWADAGMKSRGGFLCVNCLESRLRRSVTGADFPIDVPINYPGMMRDTPQLFRLKSAAWGVDITFDDAVRKCNHQEVS